MFSLGCAPSRMLGISAIQHSRRIAQNCAVNTQNISHRGKRPWPFWPPYCIGSARLASGPPL